MIEVLVPIAIILMLVVLNGLFVAAEFAIVGVPRAAIERRAQQGNRIARVVRSVLADPRRQDRFIATAQLGITVASLGLGMYGEHVLADWIYRHLQAYGADSWPAAHTVATIASVAFLTYLHIVLGEMIPKSLALQSAEKSALWITPVMQSVTLVVFPIVVALNAVGNLMLRLVGINRSEGSSDHHYSPEELALIASSSPSAIRRRARRWCRASASPASRSGRRPRTSAASRWCRGTPATRCSSAISTTSSATSTSRSWSR
jgi:CBS domain containing-hemolysin-like protein